MILRASHIAISMVAHRNKGVESYRQVNLEELRGDIVMVHPGQITIKGTQMAVEQLQLTPLPNRIKTT